MINDDRKYRELQEKIRELELENNQLLDYKWKYEKLILNFREQSDVFLHEIINILPVFVSHFSAESLEYEYVNKFYAEAIDLPCEQIVGRPVKDFLDGNNFKFILDHFDDLKLGRSVNYENYFVFNSKKYWIRAIYAPRFNTSWNVISIISFYYDITEKKDVEIAFNTDREKYRWLIEESSDPIFAFTYEGRYIYVNKAFAVNVQKDQDFIIGRTIWDVFPKDEADKRYATVKKTFESGEPQIIEVRVPNTGGDLYYITTTTPVKDEDGNVQTIICISKNITSRKIAEMELQKSENFLRIANVTKDKFFSIIAHDLINPFNSIMGISEILLEHLPEYDTETLMKFVRGIYTSSNDAYLLLENLLEWSRAQTGRIEYKPEFHEFRDLVFQTIGLTENMAKAKGITINSSEYDGLMVFGDKNMITAILRNLVTNAVKFSQRDGLVTIDAQRTEDEVIISVKDTGIGIDTDTIEKLFIINEKTSEKGTENEKGTGLGLILCKEFVDKHGGKIWVESEPGKGSLFSFTLPLPKNIP